MRAKSGSTWPVCTSAAIWLKAPASSGSSVLRIVALRISSIIFCAKTADDATASSIFKHARCSLHPVRYERGQPRRHGLGVVVPGPDPPDASRAATAWECLCRVPAPLTGASARCAANPCAPTGRMHTTRGTRQGTANDKPHTRKGGSGTETASRPLPGRLRSGSHCRRTR